MDHNEEVQQGGEGSAVLEENDGGDSPACSSELEAGGNGRGGSSDMSDPDPQHGERTQSSPRSGATLRGSDSADQEFSEDDEDYHPDQDAHALQASSEFRARQSALESGWEGAFTETRCAHDEDRTILLRGAISQLYAKLCKPITEGHPMSVGDYCVTQLHIREVCVDLMNACPHTLNTDQCSPDESTLLWNAEAPF